MPEAVPPLLAPVSAAGFVAEIVPLSFEPVCIGVVAVIGVINGPANEIGLLGPPLATQRTKKNKIPSEKKSPSLMCV
jgi:hypothetical protein